MQRFLIFTCTFLLFISTNAQQNLTGYILDEENNPVQGALIRLKDSQKSTISNRDGSFLISEIKQGNQLIITHVSFDPLVYEVSDAQESITIILSMQLVQLSQVLVEATRADNESPLTFTNINGETLKKMNSGQDVPFLLDLTPSVTITSDAGNGIGYTGMRIRGSDLTRINVSINGVPVNDSESHSVYFVDMPDLVSSTNNIQIQRGVGTSTNGSGAFGATVNFLTSSVNQKPYSRLSSAAGSFNSFRNSIQFGSGILNNHWTFDGRFSTVKSDGYVDRAKADLSSYYLEGGYISEKSMVRLIHFSGKERTYQAWWGTPEARINNDVEGMNLVADLNGYSDAQRENLLTAGRTFNYYTYKNEVDDYKQNHYQLHYSYTINRENSLNAALHYTNGFGFYEQFKANQSFENYDLQPINTTNGVIDQTDLVRRRWLDNQFFGTTFSYIFENDAVKLTAGGSFNKYDGGHYGEVIWAEYSPGIEKDYRYYDNKAVKIEENGFVKLNYKVNHQLNLFADLQGRRVNYSANGPDNDRIEGVPVQIDFDHQYLFLNPKMGLSYLPSPTSKWYVSFARSNREPVRSDFIDNASNSTPKNEILDNIELGWETSMQKASLMTNLYVMNYTDQLVLTGALNDVGAPIRTNVDRSYRAGLEVVGRLKLSEKLNWSANLTISKNKIKEFTEVIYDYGTNWDEFNVEEIQYSNVDIAFSPSMISSSELTWIPLKNTEFALISKYVGKQYLDNTGNENRVIMPYLLHNLRVSHNFYPKSIENIRLSAFINNILNEKYENNGYTYGYKAGAYEVRENYLYPQAGINFMLSVDFIF